MGSYKQSGGIIGRLLSSIAAAMILNKLVRGGLRNKRSGRGLRSNAPNKLAPSVPLILLLRENERKCLVTT